MGLIGGILMIVGLFTPWFSHEGYEQEETETKSGWDLTDPEEEDEDPVYSPYFLLIGGILAVIGALVIGSNQTGSKVLLLTAAALGFIGVSLGIYFAEFIWTGESEGASMGFGFFAAMIGNFLVLFSTLGIKE